MNARRATSLLVAILAPALLSVLAQKNGLEPGTRPAGRDSFGTLDGSRPAPLTAEKEKGTAADPSTVLNMRIVFARSAEQQAALDRLETEVLDERSANYRKWLTAEQFGTLFGPADADVAALVAWLQSQGFKVNPLSPARVSVSFSGSIHQAEQAFRTGIRTYQANGQQFFAPATDPVIPAALKGTIAGVTGLITLHAMADHAAGPIVTHDPGMNRWETAAVQNTTIDHRLTNRTSYLAITPAD